MAIEWLAQPVTVPLWGLLVAIILPLGYFAKLARQLIEQRLPQSDTE